MASGGGSAGPGSTPNKTLLALSALLEEEMSFNWRVEDFRKTLKIAIERNSKVVGKLEFSVEYRGEFKWNLWRREEAIWASLSRGGSKSQRVESGEVLRDFLASIYGEIRVGTQTTAETEGKGQLEGIHNFRKNEYGFKLFDYSEVDNHLDVDGSLTLALTVTFYSNVGNKAIFVGREHKELDEKCREEALNGISSLLGDQNTSDVTISIVKEEEEVGKFLCHRAILSARSPVFRAMFQAEEMAEAMEGLVKVEDVSAEAMEQFLTFVYSGRLKGKRKEGSDEPGWVELLPRLVYVADKYDVGSLRSFCDAHLHRAVTNDNAAELFALAKRHGLEGAQAKLRREFARNMELLLESVGK